MIVIKRHSPCMRFRHAAKDKDKFMVTFVVLVTCTFCLVVLQVLRSSASVLWSLTVAGSRCRPLYGMTSEQNVSIVKYNYYCI